MSRHLLKRDVTRLKVVHRQRVLRQGDADPAPVFRSTGYEEAVLVKAQQGWQRLVETEHESVVIAGWMTAALARLGAPLDIVGAFGRVVEDEIRHVDICAQMVEIFGGQPTLANAAAPPFPAGDLVPGSAAEFEVMSGLLSFFCVFEQMSGLVFRQAIAEAQVEVAQWALGEIFKDEAFHGTFGFEAARLYVPGWAAPRRAQMATRAIEAIRRFESRLGGPLPAGPAAGMSAEEAALEQLGLLSSGSLLRTFYGGLQTHLLPRLAELGLDLDVAVRSADEAAEAGKAG